MKLQVMPLSKLAAVKSGGGAPQDPYAFTRSGFPFIRAGSLPKLLDGEDESSLEKLEPEVATEHGLSLFPAGTVLFAKSGMSATKGHVYRLKSPAYVVNHLAALIPHTPGDSAFMVRALQRFPPTALIKDAAYPSIRLGDIENMKVVAPADPVGRRRIAEILDKADALRAKRRASIAQLDALTQSIFLDMFGDPATNPKGFPIRVLTEFYVNQVEGTKCGPFGSALKKHELVSDGIPVWNMDNIGPSGRMILPFRMWITEGKYKQLKAYAIEDGDVIVSRAGTVGKMCVVKTGGLRSIISTNLIRLRFGPDLLPLYFVSLMMYCKGRVGRLKTGADGALTHMNTGILDTLKFPYPPLELQSRFAAIVAWIERQKSKHTAQLAGFEMVFANLQQSAFRGEL